MGNVLIQYFIIQITFYHYFLVGTPNPSYRTIFDSKSQNLITAAFASACLFRTFYYIISGGFILFLFILFNRGRTSIAVGAYMVYQPQLKKEKRKGKPALPKVCFCFFIFSFCRTILEA